MFGIGLPELILIMGLALIVVGPDKLPGLAKSIAKQILELKKTANSLKESLQEELHEEDELREKTTPINMKEKPLLENHDAEDHDKIYDPLGEGNVATEFVPPQPEAFNANKESVAEYDNSESEDNKNNIDEETGEKS